MSQPNKNFFMDIHMESSDHEENTEVQDVFQNKAHVLTRDNARYIERLRDELAAVGRLNQKYSK